MSHWSAECDTSRYLITPRATSTTTDTQKEQHIQPIGNKEYDQGILQNIFLLIRLRQDRWKV